jgi:hypothetical protein
MDTSRVDIQSNGSESKSVRAYQNNTAPLRFDRLKAPIFLIRQLGDHGNAL